LQELKPIKTGHVLRLNMLQKQRCLRDVQSQRGLGTWHGGIVGGHGRQGGGTGRG